MGKRAYRSVQEALEDIRKCAESIKKVKEKYNPDFSDLVEARTLGKPLISDIYKICEGLLYVLCDAKADINGERDWPQMKNLLIQGDCVGATYDARVAAAGMTEIKSDIGSRDVTTDDLDVFFKAVLNFVKWIRYELTETFTEMNSYESEGIEPDCFAIAEYLTDTLDRWVHEMMDRGQEWI